MDKSWMTKFWLMKEYIDGCRLFVDFAIDLLQDFGKVS
jgi:hypothetical protein